MTFANQLNMDLFVPALVFAALANKSFDLMANWRLALGGTVIVLGSGPRLAGGETDEGAGEHPAAADDVQQPATWAAADGAGLSANRALPLAVALLRREHAALFASAPGCSITTRSCGTCGRAGHRRGHRRPGREPAQDRTVGAALHRHQDARRCLDPLLLFSLGVRLTDSVSKDVTLGLRRCRAVPAGGMAIAWAMAPLLGVDDMQAGMLLIFGALPPAVPNHIFAEKYKQEPGACRSIVMIGNTAAVHSAGTVFRAATLTRLPLVLLAFALHNDV